MIDRYNKIVFLILKPESIKILCYTEKQRGIYAMFLALNEIKHSKLRYALVIGVTF
jgi:hypothetical protein